MHSTYIRPRLRYLCTLILILAIVGCDKFKDESTLLDEGLALTDTEITSGDPALVIDTVTYSQDLRCMHFDIRRHQNLDQHFLGDTNSVKIKVKEYIDAIGVRMPSRCPARLTATRIIGPREIDSLGIRLVCIIDLTLDYNLVERQRHAIADIRGLFRPDRLQLRFITDEGLSQPFSCTDYILGTHVVPTGTGYKKLYRHVLTALNESRGRADGIILMSDGKVYDEDLAMDDNHYALQERLYNICTRGESVSSFPQFFYYNLNPAPAVSESDVTALSQESESILKLLTEYTGGYMTYDFKGNTLMSKLLRQRGIDFSTIGLTLTQPAFKSYYGSTHEYRVEIRDAKSDSLLAGVTHRSTLGTILNPVYTDKPAAHLVLSRALLVTIVILLCIYLTIQFIIPWVRFSYFKYRYIGRYHGLNTYIGGHIVEEQCYYCKGNFGFGDEVVAACSHTMHRDCWADNEYRCPEHGHDPKCNASHHYYNPHNLLDRRNGHYSLEWFIYTTLACFVIWMLKFLFSDFPILVITPFVLTVVYSTLTIQRTRRYSTICYALGRGLIALVVMSALNALISNLYTLYQWTEYPLLSILLYTLCCVISGFTIAICSTRYTLAAAIKPVRLVIAIAAVAIVEILFNLYYLYSEESIQLALLFCLFIENGILCAAICYPRHHSLHYFLHCEGSIKPIDIALYKWFNANPTAQVHIGSSVDCELQLLWDIQSAIAPIQAYIYQSHGRHYLEPVEDGVFDINGRPLATNVAVRLYHGYRFTIGNSTFAYIEKD